MTNLCFCSPGCRHWGSHKSSYRRWKERILNIMNLHKWNMSGLKTASNMILTLDVRTLLRKSEWIEQLTRTVSCNWYFIQKVLFRILPPVTVPCNFFQYPFLAVDNCSVLLYLKIITVLNKLLLGFLCKTSTVLLTNMPLMLKHRIHWLLQPVLYSLWLH